jgi:hypothetical protein
MDIDHKLRGKRPTLNVQHPTPNSEMGHALSYAKYWALSKGPELTNPLKTPTMASHFRCLTARKD